MWSSSSRHTYQELKIIFTDEKLLKIAKISKLRQQKSSTIVKIFFRHFRGCDIFLIPIVLRRTFKQDGAASRGKKELEVVFIFQILLYLKNNHCTRQLYTSICCIFQSSICTNFQKKKEVPKMSKDMVKKHKYVFINCVCWLFLISIFN